MSKPRQLDLSCVYDFYTLYAIKSELETVTPGIHRKVDILLADVCGQFHDLVDALHPALGQYLYLASFAEARHASGRCSHIIRDITMSGWGREQASKAAVGYNPVSTLLKLCELFSNPWHSAGFGGKKWGDIAQASYRYFTNQLPPIIFIDHVVSIQHNGGMAFSKGSSAGLVKLKLDDGASDLTHYLNVRAKDKDILDPKTDEYIKYAMTSLRTSTLQLLRRHWFVYRESAARATWIDAIVANYRKEKYDLYGFPEPYLLKFGTKETSEVENTITAAISKPYNEEIQSYTLGEYDEYTGQAGETDRNGNELPKPEPKPAASNNVQGMPQGKYIIVDISEW
jgi:hypothetical protein